MTSSVKRHGQFTAEPRTVGKFLIILNGRSVGPDTGKEAPIEIESANGNWLEKGNEFKIHERKILIIQKILEIRQSLNHYSEKTKMKRTRSTSTKEMLSQGFEFRTAGIRGRARPILHDSKILETARKWNSSTCFINIFNGLWNNSMQYLSSGWLEK